MTTMLNRSEVRHRRDVSTSTAYQEFLAEHGPDFTTPLHISGAFSEVERLSTSLIEAIRAITVTRDGSVRMRAFDGFALNYRLTNKLAAAVPHERDAPSWLFEHGGPSACVAINELSRWSVDLTDWYIDRIAELTSIGGHLGIQTLDTYTFVSGGKGWTPFGIHNDYEPSFIYHLGPGVKTAWIWPEGEPAGAVLTESPALNGVSFDIADHLATAHRHVLEPGDFLCIPAGLYHIFENTEPSAFLGITVFPNSVERVFDALVDECGAAPPAQCESAAAPTMRDSLEAAKSRLENDLTTLMERHDRRQQRLRSAGFVHPPHHAALGALPEFDLNRSFSARFPGVFAPGGADDHVAVLGRTMRTGVTGDIVGLCEVLNALQEATLEEVADAIAEPADKVADMLCRFALLGGLTQ